MKHYSVITGWIERPNNLNPAKVHRFPDHKGNIDVIAINREVAELCVLVDHVDLSELVMEISADDPVSRSMMPKTPNNLLCGSKLLIAN